MFSSSCFLLLDFVGLGRGREGEGRGGEGERELVVCTSTSLGGGRLYPLPDNASLVFSYFMQEKAK